MIQAKDSRFGNKVYNQAGEVITVQKIKFNTIVYDSQMKVDAPSPVWRADVRIQYPFKTSGIQESFFKGSITQNDD